MTGYISGLAVLSIENAKARKLDVSKKLLTILQVQRRGEESFEFDVMQVNLHGYRKRHADMEDKC